MRVITVASQKGGAGKTTIASHLAIAAIRDGMRAAIIDTDPQASLSEWWNLRESDDLLFVQSSVAKLEQSIKAIRDDGVEMLFIDTPPSITSVIRDVVALSDIVLIPTRPSPLDIRAVSKTVDIVEGKNKPMVFIVSIAKKNARITAETAIGLSQYGVVAPVSMGDRGEFAICMIDGRTVMEVFPKGNSAAEVNQLWDFTKNRVKRVVS